MKHDVFATVTADGTKTFRQLFNTLYPQLSSHRDENMLLIEDFGTYSYRYVLKVLSATSYAFEVALLVGGNSSTPNDLAHIMRQINIQENYSAYQMETLYANGTGLKDDISLSVPSANSITYTIKRS